MVKEDKKINMILLFVFVIFFIISFLCSKVNLTLLEILVLYGIRIFFFFITWCIMIEILKETKIVKYKIFLAIDSLIREKLFFYFIRFLIEILKVLLIFLSFMLTLGLFILILKNIFAFDAWLYFSWLCTLLLFSYKSKKIIIFLNKYFFRLNISQAILLNFIDKINFRKRSYEIQIVFYILSIFSIDFTKVSFLEKFDNILNSEVLTNVFLTFVLIDTYLNKYYFKNKM